VRNRRDEISPERQLANCQAAADGHGWQVREGDIYQDAEGHRSGRTEDHRPAWQALKNRVAIDPSVAAVVFNSLDRGSRSPKDFFNFLDLVQERGVEIVSVTEQFDTSTAIGRAFLAILMVIASLESDLASERTTSTIDYLKAQGIHWGFTPYGYTRDENAVLQPNDDAAVVLAALRLWIEGDRSYLNIAGRLNSEGYRWRDRDGNPIPFTRSAVRSLVANVLIYAGWVPQGRSKDIVVDNVQSLRDLVVLTEAVPGQHTPIIDEAMADEVLRVRSSRKQLAVRHEDHVYILTPLLYCAECGQRLRGKVRRTNGHVYCHRTACNAGEGSFDLEDLEAQALELLTLELPAEIVADLRDQVTARVRVTPENQELQGRIDCLGQQKRRLRDVYLLGDCSRDEYLSLKRDLDAQIEELEQQMSGPDYPFESTVHNLADLSQRIRHGTRTQQKRAFGLIFEKVFVNKEGQITEVVPHEWAKPLLSDLLARHFGNGDHGCPQGTFTAIVVAIAAGVKAARLGAFYSAQFSGEQGCQRR